MVVNPNFNENSINNQIACWTINSFKSLLKLNSPRRFNIEIVL